ncbi:MAG: DUF3078 domain-containing protein [Bacteroidales bacterium]|jgi:hypothetical protein|nr:DUF3078 domain-containing protein [Bacteroidales bacterium]
MKIKLFVVLFLFFTLNLSAQITDAESALKKRPADTVRGWKTGGVMSLSFAQTSLTNWASGGENSLSINGIFSVFAQYKDGKNVWDNSLDMGYGLLGTGDGELEYKKTDDKIDFLSKYGRQAHKNFYYAALLNCKTQMTNGYDYSLESDLPISTYLAPAYITTALGMDYKPDSYLSVFFAPVTSRITVVTLERLANAGSFGVEPAVYDSLGVMIEEGEKYRSEVGGYIRVIYSRKDFEKEWLQNVSLTSKIDLFSNYLNSPENIDINWENQLVFKLNQYLHVTFNTQLIYDDDILIGKDTNGDGENDERFPRLQFKQILGVGFSFSF